MSTHNNYIVKRMLFKSKEKKEKNVNNNNNNNIIIIYYKPTWLMCFVHLNLEPMCVVTIGAAP
jgi:hypothetical protein